MIKTLRITSILAACVAIVFIVLSAMFGLKKDAAREKFLATPGAIDAFRKNARQTSSVADAPLVKLAQSLSLKWNPPKPIEAPTLERPVIAMKFKLVSTCFNPADPGRSVALIDDTAKGLRWVGKNEKIDTAVVVEVNNGKLVYKEGSQTHELFTPKTNQPVMASSPRPAASGMIGTATVATQTPPTAQAVAISDQQPSEPPKSPEELKKEAKENADFIRQAMADMQKSSMTPEQANDVREMGEFLKQIEAQAADANAPAGPNSTPAAPPQNTTPKPPDINKSPGGTAPGSDTSNSSTPRRRQRRR